MEYRACNNRCAVILNDLDLPIPREQILEILHRKGFELLNVDIITLARERIGKSQYRRGARMWEAPEIFDCSSFVKWLYARRGIWLPRRGIQQRQLGETINQQDLIAGDAVFTSGRINYHYGCPENGVGHVGITTDRETMIHAARKGAGVTETPLAEFIGNNKFRGARRYIPRGEEVLTFETPLHWEIETADDFRWIVLQNLPR